MLSLNVIRDRKKRINDLYTITHTLKFVASAKRVKLLKYLQRLKNMNHAIHTNIAFDTSREMHIILSCDHRFCKGFIKHLNQHIKTYKFPTQSRIMIFGKQSAKVLKNAELYRAINCIDDSINIALQIIGSNFPNVFIHSYVNDNLIVTQFASFTKFNNNYLKYKPFDEEIRFCLAYWINYFVVENSLKEQSDRAITMTDASTNAEKMLNKLILDENKARQSAITNEAIATQ